MAKKQTPNKYETKTKDMYSSFLETDPKYNDELKADLSPTTNPYHSRSREIFGTYFMNRHDSNGAYYPNSADHLTANQRKEFNHYTARKMYEGELLNQGYEKEDIAVMRQWDQDLQDAAIMGKASEMLAGGQLLTTDYREKAIQQYTWDEGMYSKYVESGREIANQVFDPDGDGVLNVTDQAIDELAVMKPDEVKSLFEWMRDDQKAMLGFDGIHSGDQFVEKVRELYAAKHSNDGHHGIEGFFLGALHGFVKGVSEFIQLFPMAIGALGLVSGKTDNPLTQWGFKAARDVDESITGGFDDLLGIDPEHESGAFKVGSWTGQAVEIAAEMVLTAGAGALLKKGAQRASVAVGKKMIQKGIAPKAAASWVARNASKLIDREATALARKAGSKAAGKAFKSGGKKVKNRLGITITADVMDKAIINVSKKLGIEVGEEGLAKAFKVAATRSIARMSKRGVMFEGAHALAKLGVKGAEKLGVEAAEKVATKTGEKVVEAVGKEVGKDVAEKAATSSAEEFASASVSRVLKNTKTGKLLSAPTPEAYLKLVTKMSKRPTAVGKSIRFVFGKTDALTKVFATKSFVNTVQQSIERGDGAYTALLRGTLAFGSTNMLWGKLVGAGSPTLEKLMDKMGGGAIAGIGSWALMQVKDVAVVGSKMITDGFAQKFIATGIREGKGGEFEFFGDSLSAFNLTSIAESFLTAATMHGTSLTVGGIKKVTGSLLTRTPVGKEWRIKKMNDYIDTELRKEASDGGIGGVLWEELRKQGREALIKERGLNEEQAAKIKEKEIQDAAIGIALSQGGALAEMIRAKWNEANFLTGGIELGKTLKELEVVVKEDIKKINEIIAKQSMAHDHSYSDSESQEVKEADLKFRLYIQYLATKRYFNEGNENVNKAAEELEKEGYKVKGFTAEEAVVAYAFIQEKLSAEDIKTKDIEKEIDAAFVKVDRLKKELGPGAWKKLIGLEDAYISYLSRKLDSVLENGKAKAFEEFRGAMVDAIKVFEAAKKTTSKKQAKIQDQINELEAKEERTEEEENTLKVLKDNYEIETKSLKKTREEVNEKLKKIVEKYKVVTNKTKSKKVEVEAEGEEAKEELNLDQETANGNPMSNEFAETVEEADAVIVKEMVTKQSKKDAILNAFKAAARVFGYGNSKNTKDENHKAAKKILAEIKRAYDEGYRGQLLTPQKYRENVSHAMEEFRKDGIDVDHDQDFWKGRTINDLKRAGIGAAEISTIKNFIDALKAYNKVKETINPGDEGYRAKIGKAKKAVDKFAQSAHKFNGIREQFETEEDKTQFFDDVVKDAFVDLGFDPIELSELIGGDYRADHKELVAKDKEISDKKEAQAKTEQPNTITTAPEPITPKKVEGQNKVAKAKLKNESKQMADSINVEGGSVADEVKAKAETAGDKETVEKINKIEEEAKNPKIEFTPEEPTFEEPEAEKKEETPKEEAPEDKLESIRTKPGFANEVEEAVDELIFNGQIDEIERDIIIDKILKGGELSPEESTIVAQVAETLYGKDVITEEEFEKFFLDDIVCI